MSGGPRSRFPRTTKSVSADRLTIEREKIRHRRPDDMRVHEPESAPDAAGRDSSYWPEEETYDDTQSPWSDGDDAWLDQNEESSTEAQDWDEGADDEWVFDDPAANDDQMGGGLDDGGVTWEDANDIQMRAPKRRADPDDEGSFGPEVELAGRRDVRPRPPKRPRPPQAGRQQFVDDDQPIARPKTGFGPVGEDIAPERSPSPAPARQTRAPQTGNRFTRTQATIEIAPDSPSSVSRMPPSLQTTQRPPSRRRQPSIPPIPPSVGKPRGRKRSPLKMLGIVALIGAGGWFAYQSLSGPANDGLLDQWGDTLGVSEPGRTAEDTQFGSSATDGDLTNLQTAPDRTEFLPSATDPNSQTGGPLTSPVDGPPIPQFKPRSDVAGATGSGSTAPSVQVEQIEVPTSAAPEKEEEGPSFMQKIWGNLISN